MRRDPVCGVMVDPDATDLELVLEAPNGETYYFCSVQCKLEFEEDVLPQLLREQASREKQPEERKARNCCS